MIEIPFLGDTFPEEIITESHIRVPGLPAIPFDHQEFFDDFVPKMMVHRERVARDCSRSSEMRKAQKALCRQPWGFGKVYFDMTFNWIYEPREDDDFSEVPMILYPSQVLLLFLLDYIDRQPKGPNASLAVAKSRAVGATWIVSSNDLCDWLFKKMMQMRFVSRTEDLVDAVGDSDAYFWKLDYQVDRLPSWMVPKGYTTQRGTTWRTHMKMVNPETGSAIRGEATSSAIGVGGRARRYVIDEAARIRNFASVWGTLGETTNHRIAISTHNGEISWDFWDMCHGLNGWEKPVVYTMPWDCVPGRDEQWLEETRKTMKYHIFQREVMMNPHAGVSTWVYPQARTMIPTNQVWRPGFGMGFTGLDDGYDDDFAIGWFQWDRDARRLIALDAYQNSQKTIRYYGNLLRGHLDGKYQWDMEAQRLAQWITRYQLWQNTHIGDRHGENTSLTDGKSPWQIVNEEFGIFIQPSSSVNNDDKSRQDALGEMLLTMEFGDTPGAWAMLEAIQNNKKPPMKEGSEFTAEHRKAIHDQTSHLTTMAQYVAMYVMEHFVGRIFGGVGIARPDPVSNNWLVKRQDPFNRKYVRQLQREEESRSWIR
jgi:hypothetical protein